MYGLAIEQLANNLKRTCRSIRVRSAIHKEQGGIDVKEDTNRPSSFAGDPWYEFNVARWELMKCEHTVRANGWGYSIEYSYGTEQSRYRKYYLFPRLGRHSASRSIFSTRHGHVHRPSWLYCTVCIGTGRYHTCNVINQFLVFTKSKSLGCTLYWPAVYLLTRGFYPTAPLSRCILRVGPINCDFTSSVGWWGVKSTPRFRWILKPSHSSLSDVRGEVEIGVATSSVTRFVSKLYAPSPLSPEALEYLWGVIKLLATYRTALRTVVVLPALHFLFARLMRCFISHVSIL